MNNDFLLPPTFATELDPLLYSTEGRDGGLMPVTRPSLDRRSMISAGLKNDSASTHTISELTFPLKLHMILSSERFQHIISWLPCGEAWMILDANALEEKVLRVFFKTGTLASFLRQLMGWGFVRFSKSYHHELFVRGKPNLAKKMKYRSARARDEIASRNTIQHHSARSPNVPPSPCANETTAIEESSSVPPSVLASIDSFTSTLSTGEIRFLLHGRSHVGGRSAADGILKSDADASDFESYFAGVSDRLQAFTSDLRQQVARATAANISSDRTQHVANEDSSASEGVENGVEEKDRRVMRLSRAHGTNTLAWSESAATLSRERARWQEMKREMISHAPWDEHHTTQELPLIRQGVAVASESAVEARETSPLGSYDSVKHSQDASSIMLSSFCRGGMSEDRPTAVPVVVQRKAARRESIGSASTLISEATQPTTTTVSRSSGCVANDLPNSLESSLTIVKAAYDAMRRADALADRPPSWQDQEQNERLGMRNDGASDDISVSDVSQGEDVDPRTVAV